MVKLAHDTDSKLSHPSEHTYVYDSNGVLMNDQKVLHNFKAFWEILSDAFRQSSENYKTIKPDLSLKDYFRDRLQASALDEELQNIVLELAETWGAFVGDPIERQSLKWVWLEECLDGGKS